MSGFLRQINGADAAASQREAQAAQAQAQSSSNAQLALLAKSQATSDNASAAMNAPGLGQQMLQYRRRDSAQALGG